MTSKFRHFYTGDFAWFLPGRVALGWSTRYSDQNSPITRNGWQFSLNRWPGAVVDKHKGQEIFRETMLEKLKDVTHITFILRHDQVDSLAPGLYNIEKFLGIKFELVHKSPDFCNLNYCAGNILNLYIYKVVKNG